MQRAINYCVILQSFCTRICHHIDPRGRPLIKADSDHCFGSLFWHKSSVRPSPLFKFKQNKFQAETMFATGETMGLAEWIIDDTCLVKN